MKDNEIKSSKCDGLLNKIITNKNEAKELSNFLFKTENINFKLLYQATRDGDKISDIIKKIEGYSPTLFLLYTKRGIKCGGFTKALWNLDDKYKYDSSSFLFNFSNKQLFNIKNSNEAIFCDNDCLCFGNASISDYYIRNLFLSQKVYEAKVKQSYYSNNYEVQGEEDAEIYELEIYHC